ncbi:MAG: glutamine--fructose-6-phosphate transaminase (isomerizing) [Pseudomonadota bacterium]
MCGIVGIVGTSAVAERLVEGLRRLEYRGYDSAGVATLVDGAIERQRTKGKLFNLEKAIYEQPLAGTTGIGHTRWATHGAPTVNNAHPHVTDRVAVVHNGIIENFKQLRDELEREGARFQTDTDTEVIAVLISQCLAEGSTPLEAVSKTLAKLEGAFALAIIFAGENDLMIGARRGSPLVLGYGRGEMFLGSDALALALFTNRITYLEEGDMVVLSRDAARIFDEAGKEVVRAIDFSAATAGFIDKGNYRHYMLKEIFEQPTVVGQTLGSYIDPLAGRVQLPELPFELAEINKITIIACGTSYYAGLVARYWIEQFAKIPVEVDIASEFRYREPVLRKGDLAVFISQSGETADTLAAMRHCRANDQHSLVIVNQPESSMAREADAVLSTHAGPEIGVASTKAFTCQLAVLAVFSIAVARARGTLSAEDEAAFAQSLTEVPARMADVLNHDEAIEKLGHDIAKARDVLYLGRGVDYPLALEGALKLKEISYIHAEGYAAGEMKHGPIALIDEAVPVIVIAPSGPLFEKSISNMREVAARDAIVILMSDAAGIQAHGSDAFGSIEMPPVTSLTSPLLYAIPVQLLAYHVAVAKGTDVDQPRNLAKSVTVE